MGARSLESLAQLLALTRSTIRLSGLLLRRVGTDPTNDWHGAVVERLGALDGLLTVVEQLAGGVEADPSAGAAGSRVREEECK